MTVRSTQEIAAAEARLFDQVTYDRLVESLNRNPTGPSATTTREALVHLEAKYQRGDLIFRSDYEWGMIHGKLSALRWVLGRDWDVLA